MFRKRDVAIHFVGIGGIGMSGIAEVLLNLGYPVSGSDLKASDVTRRLVTLGARVAVGHAAKNVVDVDVVVVSSAVDSHNPEVVAARQAGIPVIPRAEMLGELMRVKDGVAVAGSHGKTSTTSMVAAVFAQAGLDPTVIVGGVAKALGSNARLGQGDVLVAEADESDGSFRHLSPMAAVITNIDREHMDHYGDLAALRTAFLDFANKVPFYGLVVICADDPGAAALAPDLLKRHVTYGLSGGDYRGVILEATPEGTRFEVSIRGKARGPVHLKMPGVHYAQNALATLAIADFFGVSFDDYREAMAGLGGVDRRFSIRGEAGGVLVVDDYGHHPTEIAATLAAARLYQRRTVVAFQPHRYSRTQDLLRDFAPALAGADEIVITDVYAAGEKAIPGVDTAALIATFPSDHPAKYLPRPQLASGLAALVRPGDLVLTLGAGDITQVGPDLLARLRG
jgi:UDP-N-acetylmuramate--alanine ligase